MPYSDVRTFTDPDEYAGTLRASTRLTITGLGGFNEKRTRIELHRLWMRWFSENLQRAFDLTNALRGRAYMTFRTQPGPSLFRAVWSFVRPTLCSTAIPLS